MSDDLITQELREELLRLATLSDSLLVEATLKEIQKKTKIGIRPLRKEVETIKKEISNREEQVANNTSKNTFAITIPNTDIMLTLPTDYFLDSTSFLQKWNKNADGESFATKIANGSIVIEKLTHNIDTHEYGVELGSVVRGKHKTVTCKKEGIASVKKIIILSNYGFPVNSVNALALVEYLSEFEAVNYKMIPREFQTEKSGWLRWNNEHHFSFGEKIISPSDNGCQLIRNLSPESDNKILRALSKNGEREEWVKALKMLLAYDIPLFFIGVSLASPLLYVLGVDPFMAHLWGSSTKGKTTALKGAASIYGSPKKRDGIIVTWDVTIAGVESLMAMLNGLLLSLDDNTQKRSDDIIKRVVYLLANARGALRGTKDGGMKNFVDYTGACLSTGEFPNSQDSSFQGMLARMIEIGQAPFPDQSPETQAIVVEINRLLDENYGHIAEDYLKEIVRIVNDEQLKADLHEEFRAIQKRLSFEITDPFILRQVPAFASVYLGLRNLKKLVPELELSEERIENSIRSIMSEKVREFKEKSDIGDRALRYVWERIASEPSRFNENNDFERWGKIVTERGGGNDQGYAILPSCLKEILVGGGFHPDACMNIFREKEWVWLDTKGQLWTVNLGALRTRCYVFSQEVAKRMKILDDDESSVKSNRYFEKNINVDTGIV